MKAVTRFGTGQPQIQGVSYGNTILPLTCALLSYALLRAAVRQTPIHTETPYCVGIGNRPIYNSVIHVLTMLQNDNIFGG